MKRVARGVSNRLRRFKVTSKRKARRRLLSDEYEWTVTFDLEMSIAEAQETFPSSTGLSADTLGDIISSELNAPTFLVEGNYFHFIILQILRCVWGYWICHMFDVSLVLAAGSLF